MTPIEAARQAIELRKKATQGSWQPQSDGVISRPQTVYSYNDMVASYVYEPDAAFIAHAANHYAAVAEEVVRLQTLLDERDKFIVDQGLWKAFVAQIVREGQP